MKLKKIAFIFAGFLTACNFASATTVTRTVNFSADNFFSWPGGPVPTSPVTGAFDITLDNTQNYANQVTGITLTGLNIALGSALAFNYIASTDTLAVGGLANGVDSITIGPVPNDDFYMYIDDFLSSLPILRELTYGQFAAGVKYFRTYSGSASVEADVSTTPLPAALPLFISGLGALGLIARNRKRKAATLTPEPV